MREELNKLYREILFLEKEYYTKYPGSNNKLLDDPLKCHFDYYIMTPKDLDAIRILILIYESNKMYNSSVSIVNTPAGVKITLKYRGYYTLIDFIGSCIFINLNGKTLSIKNLEIAKILWPH